jgi:hypothetical protein
MADRASRSWLIAVVGFVFGPVAIALHEGGHALAGMLMGGKVHVHAIATTVAIPAGQLSLGVLAAAGPVVDMILALAGLGGLMWRARRAPPALPDWVLTAMACTSLRWLMRVPIGLLLARDSGGAVLDEVLTAEAVGIGPWVLVVPLAVLGGAVFVLVVRWHSSGQRLAPFTVLLISEAAGVLAWRAVTA